MSIDDIYYIVMPAMQACKTYRGVDILKLAYRVPKERRADHANMLFLRMTPDERAAVEAFAELKMAGGI